MDEYLKLNNMITEKNLSRVRAMQSKLNQEHLPEELRIDDHLNEPLFASLIPAMK